jgi:DNA-binding beta-propeller fold protein YncE
LVVACIAGTTVAPAADGAEKAARPPRVAPDVALTGGVDDPKGAGVVSSGATLPPIPPLTGDRKKPVASWGKPLPYPILIADRRNNRLIEIAPDKRIVWEFPTPNLTIYSGNEDVNFSPDGKRLAVSEEDNYDVHIVDYEKRELTWTYGTPEKGGSGPGQSTTRTTRTCSRTAIPHRRHPQPPHIIDPKTQKTHFGSPALQAQAAADWPGPTARRPGNGDILVTEITDAWVSRITREGKVVYSVRAPKIRYPSDTFPTVDGKQLIVADFSKPGRVVIFDPATGKPTWEYFHADGDKSLDHPSIARELPDTGDVLIVDDLHDRVIVVDRKTKEIIWQYGVLGVKGHKPGYLNYPDGVDIDVFRDWRVSAK